MARCLLAVGIDDHIARCHRLGHVADHTNSGEPLRQLLRPPVPRAARSPAVESPAAAGVAKLVDAPALGAGGLALLGVRVPPPALAGLARSGRRELCQE